VVTFDATFLLYLVDGSAAPPIDPATGLPVEKHVERVEYLIERLSEARERILIPMPALSEILVCDPESIPAYMNQFGNGKLYVLGEFDALAAVEVGYMTFQDGCIRSMRLSNETKAKLKYDRQILAISKVAGVSAIYSDDGKLCRKAAQNGIKAFGVHELPPRPPEKQGALDLRVSD